MFDKLTRDNSVGIFLSETWLKEGTLYAEVNLESFSFYRGDRVGRSRGGAAFYLKESLNGRLAKTYSDSIVEFVVVTSKVLDAVFIATYRHFT